MRVGIGWFRNLYLGERCGLLELRSADFGTLVVRSDVAVALEELSDVESRRFEDLDLSDVDVLEGVDALSSLLNLLAHDLGNQFL